jgi:hypothetical protein
MKLFQLINIFTKYVLTTYQNFVSYGHQMDGPGNRTHLKSQWQPSCLGSYQLEGLHGLLNNAVSSSGCTAPTECSASKQTGNNMEVSGCYLIEGTISACA